LRILLPSSTAFNEGRATYSMEPSHYEAVPNHISEEILAKGREAAGAR